MDVQGAFKAVQSRVRFAREAAQAFAFDVKTDMAEAWRTGLGVPHFITGLTSFACFVSHLSETLFAMGVKFTNIVGCTMAFISLPIL